MPAVWKPGDIAKAENEARAAMEAGEPYEHYPVRITRTPHPGAHLYKVFVFDKEVMATQRMNRAVDSFVYHAQRMDKWDTYVPNQISTLTQNLEYVLYLLQNGGTPEQIAKCVETTEENLGYVRETFDPEWKRLVNELGEVSHPPDWRK